VFKSRDTLAPVDKIHASEIDGEPCVLLFNAPSINATSPPTESILSTTYLISLLLSGPASRTYPSLTTFKIIILPREVLKGSISKISNFALERLTVASAVAIKVPS